MKADREKGDRGIWYPQDVANQPDPCDPLGQGLMAQAGGLEPKPFMARAGEVLRVAVGLWAWPSGRQQDRGYLYRNYSL